MPTTVTASWSAELGTLWDEALANLDRNTVAASDGSVYIRAGAGYADPWTRDTALNCWGAANVLRPAAARATLLRVCETGPGGREVIAQDEQWWDQIIWVIGAYDSAAWSGDRAFLRRAYDIGTESLAILDRERFRPRWGLYAGPALMQDGISGFPAPPARALETSSFVLDYPEAHEIMALSTNALYARALRLLAEMAAQLGEDGADHARRADELIAAVRRRLRDASGRYGYFLHGVGEHAGMLDPHREAAGLALAVAFGIADEEARAEVLASIGRGPAGVVNVAPHFPERYSDERPGRHNAMAWPMVMGLVGLAECIVDDGSVLRTLDEFARLVAASEGRFDELYDPLSGAPHGGWQCGFPWPSEPDQTWSATSYIRLVLQGVLGAVASPDGLRLRPVSLPPGAVLEVRGLPWRDARLDVVVRSVADADGSAAEARVPATARGRIRLELAVPAAAPAPA